MSWFMKLLLACIGVAIIAFPAYVGAVVVFGLPVLLVFVAVGLAPTERKVMAFVDKTHARVTRRQRVRAQARKPGNSVAGLSLPEDHTAGLSLSDDDDAT